MNWEQLLEIAELLAGAARFGSPRGRPQQMQLRKALSHAYYAVFYSLANSNADTLIGASSTIRRSREWTAAHRALNHGIARAQMIKKAQMSEFQDDIQDICDVFVTLQFQRHEADYNPNPSRSFSRSQTLRDISRARRAIEKFQNVPPQERRRFATYILFGRRN